MVGNNHLVAANAIRNPHTAFAHFDGPLFQQAGSMGAYMLFNLIRAQEWARAHGIKSM